MPFLKVNSFHAKIPTIQLINFEISKICGNFFMQIQYHIWSRSNESFKLTYHMSRLMKLKDFSLMTLSTLAKILTTIWSFLRKISWNQLTFWLDILFYPFGKEKYSSKCTSYNFKLSQISPQRHQQLCFKFHEIFSKLLFQVGKFLLINSLMAKIWFHNDFL